MLTWSGALRASLTKLTCILQSSISPCITVALSVVVINAEANALCPSTRNFRTGHHFRSWAGKSAPRHTPSKRSGSSIRWGVRCKVGMRSMSTHLAAGEMYPSLKSFQLLFATLCIHSALAGSVNCSMTPGRWSSNGLLTSMMFCFGF